MNRIQSLAAIALVAIGISISVHLGLSLVTSVYFFSSGQTPSGVEIVFFVINAIGITGAVYLLIIRRQMLAEKIVGPELPADSGLQQNWLPAAFRLTAVVAGLASLPSAIFQICSAVRTYFYSRTIDTENVSEYFTADQIVPPLVMAAISAYLIAGAPHFVRWQVKKTLQQCSKTEHSPISAP